MSAVRDLSYVLLGCILIGCGNAPPPKSGNAPAAQPASSVKINYFYAGSADVIVGQPVTLCYGVENAVSVRVEPPVEPLKPGYHRCFQATPDRSTAYRLVAEGPDGSTATQSVEVGVRARPKAPPPPAPVPALITMFLASASEIPAGMPVTLCYGAPEAVSVSISPAVQELKPARRNCFTIKPAATTTYTLTARAPDGYVETAQATVTVR